MSLKDYIKSKSSQRQLALLRAGKSFIRDRIDPYPYRRYTSRHKCIFIHIPKVAGTSILRALGHNGSRDHATYREYKVANSSKFEKYFKFTFVRNPVTRFESAFRYYKSGGNQRSTDEYFFNIINQYKMSADDFCEFIADKQHYIYTPMFWPQTLYFLEVGESCQVDFIGRFESIGEDFNSVLTKLGVKGKLERINQSGSDISGKVVLSKNSESIIRDIYQHDYEFLNYE
ncbi:sulfotransferase family 2 domain-containing protein [Kangiella shandongensis]|uniref:sulfotransferase family 2 domain-containing protein n=1 Tax=Kangiella shandongensis TaxID=2763258 RepID=UPI001CBCAB5D|nr:sulfotransferase family 2 domain-containing protein [Kangiella shandongensis]